MLQVIRMSAFLSMVGLVATAQSAEFELHPSLAVNQEYTDNVFETGNNRVSDFITRALPGVMMRYKAPAFNGHLDYLFDYRHYAKGSRGDEYVHTIDAQGSLVILQRYIFMDLSDQYQRVSLDVARTTSQESLFVNQSDRNIATVAPYVMLHPGNRTSVKTGYRFVDIRYFDSPAVNKIDHVGLVEVTHALTERLELNAGYTFTRELAATDDFNQHQGYGGFRYEYADKSFVFAQAGNIWTRYDSGQQLSSLFWNAGVTHLMDTVTASITTGKHYIEDPLRNIVEETFVTGTLEKRFSNGLISIAPIYSEFTLAQSDTLQTRKYGATVSGSYDFSADLVGNLSFAAEKYEQPLLGSYTRRFLVASGLSYLLAKELTLSFYYNYADYYSPGIAADNRHVNRAMVEIKKVF